MDTDRWNDRDLLVVATASMAPAGSRANTSAAAASTSARVLAVVAAVARGPEGGGVGGGGGCEAAEEDEVEFGGSRELFSGACDAGGRGMSTHMKQQRDDEDDEDDNDAEAAAPPWPPAMAFVTCAARALPSTEPLWQQSTARAGLPSPSAVASFL